MPFDFFNTTIIYFKKKIKKKLAEQALNKIIIQAPLSCSIKIINIYIKEKKWNKIFKNYINIIMRLHI